MKLALKIATLIFFASGIIFFVGYQSGYFFPDAPQESNESVEKETSPTVESVQKDTDTLKADNTDTITPDSASNLAKTKTRTTESKKVEFKQFRDEKVRMFSSKSAIVEPFPGNKKMRMSSSKSIRSRRSYMDIFQQNQEANPLEKTKMHYLEVPKLDSTSVNDTLK